MKDAKVSARPLGKSNRRGLAPALGVGALVAVTVVVAVAGFVVLGAIAHAASNSVKSCVPSAAPQCHGNVTSPSGILPVAPSGTAAS